ncbi:hypothetical protein LJC15_01055 [Desulfovibrio sp. OttesenSCG-928-G11]|nr:hypothetical protein [Desulfovibrio sp. OttesenSCG-928-G11]
MNVVASLENMGLSLSLTENGKLAVEGLKKLPADSRQQAVEIARAHKPAILEELKRREEAPSAAELDHARRMLVACPVQRRKLHCWYCSRCSEAARCVAWRARRQDVEFFRNSEKPSSLYLVESGEVGVVQ